MPLLICDDLSEKSRENVTAQCGQRFSIGQRIVDVRTSDSSFVELYKTFQDDFVLICFDGSSDTSAKKAISMADHFTYLTPAYKRPSTYLVMIDNGGSRLSPDAILKLKKLGHVSLQKFSLTEANGLPKLDGLSNLVTRIVNHQSLNGKSLLPSISIDNVAAPPNQARTPGAIPT